MLKLLDLIKFTQVNLGRFKIHLATPSSERPDDAPLQQYFEGNFERWQQYQSKRNFECESILSLIHLERDRWLFVGIWNVRGVQEQPAINRVRFIYSTSEVSGLEDISGRVIVSFKRPGRASYLIGERYADELLVSEIKAEKMSMADFPGFSSVLLTYNELQHIVSRDIPSWRAALQSIAGVYLITDTLCGKHYVGSAYGIEGLWGRWSLYANVPHGDNKKLKELLGTNEEVHAKNFQFSILEICDALTLNEEVLRRETHWKKALCSRKFGYNLN